MSDIREILSAAYDAGEAPSDGAPAGDGASAAGGTGPTESGSAEAVAAPAASSEASEPTAGRARGPDGKFAKAPPKPEGEAAPKEAVTESPAGKDASTPGEAPASAPPLKAPQSWKPEEREHFAKLPREAQEAVLRRENDMTPAWQQATENKAFRDQFQQTVAPFEAMLRAEGADPMRAFGSLLQTAQALRQGSPAEQARLIAGLIKQYRVPVDGVAAELDGNGPPPGQHQAAPQEFRDPRFDEFLAAQQQQQRTRAEQQLAQFAAKNEFFADVKPVMEGLLKAGVVRTLDEAYAKACRLDDGVSSVISQREAAKRAMDAQKNTERSIKAGSSPASRPSSGSQGTKVKSGRDFIAGLLDGDGGG